MKQSITILFLFFLTAGNSQEKYTIGSIPKDLTAYANSVLLEEKTVVDVSQEEKLRFSNRVVRAVLNKKGDNDVNSYLTYDKDVRVTDIEAFVYDANGKEIKHFKKRDFLDVSQNDGVSLFSDNRMLYVDYNPPSYPYIFEFIYETESATTAFIPSWFPLGYYSESTWNSSYTLKFDPANKPKIKKMNLEGYEISISENPEEYVFTASHIPAIQYEAHSLPFKKIAPQVRFRLDKFHLMGVSGYAETWNEFGNWYRQNLLEGVSNLPESTINEVRNLVKNEANNLAKARKIYQFVQNKVRYISIQVGVGGWKPMLASDVDKLSYGDCKALTNYTKALLDAVGVPSYYTILYAGDDELDILDDFVSIQGNHVFLGIPNEEDIVWLECTSQLAPFGFGGNFSDDRDVLMVTPEGGKIVHTKTYTANENLQENKATIQLDATGSLTASFEGNSKGLQYDDKYILDVQKTEDLEKYYKERWSYINGFRIENINLVNNKEEIVFSEKLTLFIPNYTTQAGNDVLFCPNVFNRLQYIPLRTDDRIQKLHISMGFEDVDTLQISWIDTYKIEDLPKDELIENKFGSYSISFEKLSENTLQYTRKLQIKKGTYEPEEYENYRDFRRKIAKLDKTKLLLKQNRH